MTIHGIHNEYNAETTFLKIANISAPISEKRLIGFKKSIGYLKKDIMEDLEISKIEPNFINKDINFNYFIRIILNLKNNNYFKVVFNLFVSSSLSILSFQKYIIKKIN